MMSSPSMDGKQGFLEALNYLPHLSTPDIFRLNQAIDGTLPELDDVGSLEAMSNMDFAVPAELVRTILASAMFFLNWMKLPSRVRLHFIVGDLFFVQDQILPRSCSGSLSSSPAPDLSLVRTMI